jgi:hypothetical protein
MYYIKRTSLILSKKHHKYYLKINLHIRHVSGINFLFKNIDLTDTFPIHVSRRIRHVSDIIFLFKINYLTDTFLICISECIGRVSDAYRTRFITIFCVPGLHSSHVWRAVGWATNNLSSRRSDCSAIQCIWYC